MGERTGKVKRESSPRLSHTGNSEPGRMKVAKNLQTPKKQFISSRLRGDLLARKGLPPETKPAFDKKPGGLRCSNGVSVSQYGQSQDFSGKEGISVSPSSGDLDKQNSVTVEPFRK